MHPAKLQTNCGAPPSKMPFPGPCGVEVGLGDESWGIDNLSVDTTSVVPEPSTLLLFGAGLLGLGGIAWRRHRR